MFLHPRSSIFLIFFYFKEFIIFCYFKEFIIDIFIGDLSGAINHYEKSDTYRFEVPRMLFDELPTLEDYIMHTDDRCV